MFPHELGGNDPDIVAMLKEHEHCFSYVAYVHQAQTRGIPRDQVLGFEDALKEAGIDFTILKINKRGEAMQISQDTAEDSRNVQNLKKKRKRMIDDLFEENKRSRLEVLQAATTSFMMKPPEPEHMQGGEMETD